MREWTIYLRYYGRFMGCVVFSSQETAVSSQETAVPSQETTNIVFVKTKHSYVQGA